jgi:Leu/Phe-tRNA-protein transferase
MTPHFEALGAKEIEREDFLDKLKETQDTGLNLFETKKRFPNSR